MGKHLGSCLTTTQIRWHDERVTDQIGQRYTKSGTLCSGS